MVSLYKYFFFYELNQFLQLDGNEPKRGWLISSRPLAASGNSFLLAHSIAWHSDNFSFHLV